MLRLAILCVLLLSVSSEAVFHWRIEDELELAPPTQKPPFSNCSSSGAFAVVTAIEIQLSRSLTRTVLRVLTTLTQF